jgi:hypothetical protein
MLFYQPAVDPSDRVPVFTNAAVDSGKQTRSRLTNEAMTCVAGWQQYPNAFGRRSAVQDEGFLLLELGLSQHARRQQLAELLQLGEPVTDVGWLRRDSRCLGWRDRLGVGLLRLCRGRVLRWRRGGRSCRIGLALRCPPLLLPALNPAVHGAGDRDGGGGLK